MSSRLIRASLWPLVIFDSTNSLKWKERKRFQASQSVMRSKVTMATMRMEVKAKGTNSCLKISFGTLPPLKLMGAGWSSSLGGGRLMYCMVRRGRGLSPESKVHWVLLLHGVIWEQDENHIEWRMSWSDTTKYIKISLIIIKLIKSISGGEMLWDRNLEMIKA